MENRDNREKNYIDAYIAGRTAERELAVEAYRLRCCHLFGNRCMERSIFGSLTKKVCDGNCQYIKQYKQELYKLEA